MIIIIVIVIVVVVVKWEEEEEGGPPSGSSRSSGSSNSTLTSSSRLSFLTQLDDSLGLAHPCICMLFYGDYRILQLMMTQWYLALTLNRSPPQ